MGDEDGVSCVYRGEVDGRLCLGCFGEGGMVGLGCNGLVII